MSRRWRPALRRRVASDNAKRSARAGTQNSKRPEAIVVIRNLKGLHARASAKFVKCAESYDANITVTRDGQMVGGTSIMGLMMLAAGPGSELHISAEGKQGPEALAALVALVEAGFDEECVGDG